MWHVDEGALHAYLDGALDEYPAAEAHRVREHLETCTECADRLADERRVRDEAQEILGLASPRVEVPTFEELRAYVKARVPQRSIVSVRLYRLSWAASVVLALGTGWLVRGEGPPERLSPAASAYTADAEGEASVGGATAAGATELLPASEPAADAVDGGARSSSPSGAQALLDGASADAAPAARGSTAAAPAPTAAGRPAEVDVPTAGLAVEPERERRESVVQADEVAANRALASEPVPEVAAAADTPATKVADDPTAETTVAGAPDIAPEPASAGPPAAQRAPEQRLSSAVRQAPAAQGLGASAPSLGRAVGSDTAADRVDDDAQAEAVSLVVPGLEVLDVLPVGEGTTFAGMRALQRLPTGDTLETAHLPAGADLRSLPPLREGWSELIRARGSGWLVMRAPLDEQTLTELLQRLEGGR